MDRRSFLKTTAGAIAGLALLGQAVASPKTYVLYGDGKHDDTEALQAWADGLPVVSGGYMTVTPTDLSGGDFRIRKTIHIQGECVRRLTNCQLEASQKLDGPVLEVDGKATVFITGCCFKAWEPKYPLTAGNYGEYANYYSPAY